MHPLSNAGRPDLSYGPATPSEQLDALKVLTDGNDSTAREFHRKATQLGYPLERLCIAWRGKQIVAALFPVEIGGVVQIAISPNCPPTAIPGLVAAAESQFGDNVLLQTLLDPGEAKLRAGFEDAGFDRLADLLFLRRPLTVPFAAAPMPPGYESHTFTDETRPLFVEALRDSYVGSLDCPRLSNRRTPEQALDAHMKTGAFHADLWTLLTSNGKPAVVLLLNPETESRNVELVYVGVAPEFRRRHLGEWAVKRALHTAYVRKFAELTLVVDGDNHPALQMYFRHGFRRSRQRLALVKSRSKNASAETHTT